MAAPLRVSVDEALNRGVAMMRRSGRWLFGRALLCGALAACGDGGGSGVDPDKTLGETTEGERETMCEWYAEEIGDADVARVSCYIAALVVTENNPALDCEELAQECLEDEEAAQPDLECGETDVFGGLPECATDLSVGELEGCLSGFIAQVEQVSEEASCEGTSEELFEAFDLGTVRACEALLEACPELQGDPFD